MVRRGYPGNRYATTADADAPTSSNTGWTENDAAVVPPPSPSHGSYHWTFERLIAAGQIPLTVAPFASGSLNPTLEAVLCATLLIH